MTIPLQGYHLQIKYLMLAHVRPVGRVLLSKHPKRSKEEIKIHLPTQVQHLARVFLDLSMLESHKLSQKEDLSIRN